MRSGLLPVKRDLRDYDLLATRVHKLAGIGVLQPTYSVRDITQRIPNQEAEDDHFTPPVPPLPFGCTDYAQATVCGYEDQHLYNPMDLENITHASANGGGDIRTALSAATRVWGGHPAYFRITPQLGMDYFDSARLAMLATSTERRGVSVGSPFWHQWTAVGPNGKLPTPDYNLQTASWHNWVIDGWDTLGDITNLTCQMLQGDGYGNHGTVYMPREQFNATMAVSGSAMFTIDRVIPGEKVQTIGSPIIQEIVNFIRSLFS